MTVLAARQLDGVDARAVTVEVSGVAELRRKIREHGHQYLTAKFTAGELNYCWSLADPLPSLAARLAAKAATSRAIGGHGLGFDWTSIEVRRNPAGWCEIHLTDEAAVRTSLRGTEALGVSLSHESNLAIAAVFELSSLLSGQNQLISVGIDLTLVAHVQESIDRFGERFLNRVFTPLEQTDCLSRLDPVPHLAARFAAKEATIKALKVEDIQPDWPSMELRRDSVGSSYEIQLTGRAASLATDRDIGRLGVTISHVDNAAIAAVLAFRQ